MQNTIGSYFTNNPSAALDKKLAFNLGQIQNNTSAITKLPAELQTGVLQSFVQSFHIVFLSAAPITVIGLFIAMFLREAPLRTGAEHHAAKEEAAGEAIA